jgi:hypothetical protein
VFPAETASAPEGTRAIRGSGARATRRITLGDPGHAPAAAGWLRQRGSPMCGRERDKVGVDRIGAQAEHMTR